LDQSSFFISSPAIATPPEIATGAFIYERRTGRVFFFQRSSSTRKDEDHRYCPVCGNVRKVFAAHEAGRLRLQALLAEALLLEIAQQPEQRPQVVGSGDVTAAATVARPSLLQSITNPFRQPRKSSPVQKHWQHRTATRQQEGIFSSSQSRGPPRQWQLVDHERNFRKFAALSATPCGQPWLPERRAKP
jgi:hypothetical protein